MSPLFGDHLVIDLEQKMQNSPSRMPTMNALKMLESVARLGSFKGAAAELCVTPAAVSFQIRQLEKDLDTTLFERNPSGIVLTEAGAAFFPKLTTGMQVIHEAFQDFVARTAKRSVRVTSGPAVMSKWLVPKVPLLSARDPSIEVEFNSSLELVDLVRDPVDLAIRFGRSPKEASEVSEIVEEYVVPMCSPEVAQELESTADLAQFELIHDRSMHLIDEQALDWPAWFKAVGITCDTMGRGLSFSQSDHAIQAAADGAGVVLSRLVLSGPELLSGKLVVPFGPALPTGLHYYLLERKTRDENTELAFVREWIMDDIGSIFCSLVKDYSTALVH